VPQNRKRVQRDIFASPLDFQRLHPDFAGAREEQKDEETEMQVDMRPDLGYVPAGGGPNIIGNAEDGPVLPELQQLAPYQGAAPQDNSLGSAAQPGTPHSADVDAN